MSFTATAIGCDETLTLEGLCADTNTIIRKTSQKPSDELYQNFKANFPALKTGGVPSTDAPGQTLPATSLAEALDVPPNPR